MVVLSMSKKVRRPSQVAEADSDGETEQTDADVVPKEIMVIAQEVKIVQSLACNDLTKRNRQIRKLRKWLQLRSSSSYTFSQEDFQRIWKGLYYNMWMSDKPLVQEELAEQLGQLLTCFNGDVILSVNFFGAFLHTMCHQWFGIDQWRMDKFLMLVRRMLRYMFRVLKEAGWTAESVRLFSDHMTQTVLSEDVTATGLVMHYLDIFFEELAKVSQGKINAEQVGNFVRPFVLFIGTQRDAKLISHCRTRVFYHLLYQSALGREYSEKYNAWKEMGFPTTSIDDLERDENASEATEDDDAVEGEPANESTDKVLDPRAGDVDVYMPELPLDGKYVIEELEKLLYKRELSTKCRNMLKKLLAIYQQYQQGEFPLGVKTMPRFEAKSEKPLIKEKMEQLENLENDLYGTDRKLKLLNKRKRRKLLKSLNFDNIDESNFEQVIEKAMPKKYLQERRKRAQAALMGGWVEEEIDESEPVPKKKKKNKALAKNEVQTKQNDEKQTEEKEKVNEKQINHVSAKSKKVKAIREEKQKSTNNQINSQKKPIVAHEQQQNSTDVKVTTATATPTKGKKSPASVAAAWDAPLEEGEVEIFIPSRKQQVKKANANIVLNPLAAAVKKSALSTPSSPKTPNARNVYGTPGSSKRVKIALKNNTAQNPSEYLRQVKNSPDVPYDADRKPGKGLLKPNSIPSPINPFYKKKIGLRLFNDTL